MTLLVLLTGAGNRPRLSPEEERFAEERREMVMIQMEARGVENKAVLAAMRKVPRHRFVPRMTKNMAYMDSPLPIGEGQTISQPYIVALMTELAEVAPGDKVLEIGTGSGYQAAVLAELTDKVYTIEILPLLAMRAQQTLRELGYTQVQVQMGDGYLGWPDEAPFDAIVVTAAPDHVPQPLLDQLAEGGVLVVPVGPVGGFQELLRIRKREGKTEEEKVTPVSFVPLIRNP